MLPSHITLVEVGPRDGLQNEPVIVPPAIRARLITLLAEAGLTMIEAGAFVRPDLVPAMAATAQVLATLALPQIRLPVLVANRRGLADALAAGARDIAVFTAASDSFCKRNMGCSLEQSLSRFAEMIPLAQGCRVRGYISCALACPFDGPTPPARVAELAATLTALGCHEISLGDTMGTGTPVAARAMVAAVAERVPIGQLALHFHDSYGQALANILACLELGVAVVDASVAGLGGCPFAPGAGGNVATEDVLFMLDGMGITTGVRLDKVVAAGRFITDHLGHPPVSKVSRALG
ncbi:MAG: hydroxymethylglutaryl-CoA lyase [Rhodospirillaceae bacterium]|nr:hydroxymethylglutaryl-CoA lyase [Rhodospirillales bacterium]